MSISSNDAKGRKSARRAALGLLLSLVAVAASSCRMPDIEIGDPDLALVGDGAWQGYYDAELVKARVEVVVASHTIESVRILEHDCSCIGKKAESIVDEVVARQSLDVDVVSGATGSSLCILKAVELALRAGME